MYRVYKRVAGRPDSSSDQSGSSDTSIAVERMARRIYTLEYELAEAVRQRDVALEALRTAKAVAGVALNRDPQPSAQPMVEVKRSIPLHALSGRKPRVGLISSVR